MSIKKNSSRVNNSRVNGVTLVELMVALVIASVMLFFALPAFNDFTTQRRMASNVNLVISAINYARNEAARRGTPVTIQAVDAGDAANEWGPGFCIVEGDPGNCNNEIRRFSPEANITIDGTGVMNADSVTFNSRGMLTAAVVGQVRVCGADAEDDPGREVRITAIGRASILDFVCFP